MSQTYWQRHNSTKRKKGAEKDADSLMTSDLECCLENQESVHLNFIVPFILKPLNWHIFFRSRFFSIEDNFGKNFFYQIMCSVLAFWGTCPFCI